MITDGYQRVHDYLRISLTDHCNLRCAYCMPDEDYAFTPDDRLMRSEDIEGLSRVFVELGVKKIRLTGGEPLLRTDAGDILRRLSQLPVQLTLTTNATRLHLHLDDLKASGVRSLNISLDTLDRIRFQMLTRRDRFDRVMGNILLALDEGFHVKMNMVVMKGLNDQEIGDFVALTREKPLHVRFIEFMPFSGNHWDAAKVFTWQDMLARISERFEYVPLAHEPNGTAKKYQVKDHAGTFAVISTMSAPFCGDCNRIRLTADGKMKNCLFSTRETDLLGPWKRGEDIRPLIHQCILEKKQMLGGQFTTDLGSVHADEMKNRSMITIGG
jgi:GTP 3',8-cyclase